MTLQRQHPDLTLPFLLGCSRMTLQDLELSLRNQSSITRKQIFTLFDQLVDMQEEARIVRLLLDHREELIAQLASVPMAGPHKAELPTARKEGVA